MKRPETGPFDFDGSQQEQQRQAMNELIAELNDEQETGKGLFPPKGIDELNWSAFAIQGELGARAVLHTKRLMLQLRPKSLRQQIYMFCEVIDEDDNISLKTRWTVMGALFGTSADNVRSMYRNYKDKPGTSQPGRRRLLSEEQIQQLIREVDQRAKEKNPMTRREMVNYVFSQWNMEISKRTVNRLIRDREELVSTVAMPMERTRAEVTQGELEAFYRQLKENLDGVLPESIVNLDEVGFSRKSRGSPLQCIIPKELDGRKIEYIQREETDSTFTVLTAVTLAGEYLVPYLVIPVKSLPNEFLTNEMWTGKDCVLDFNHSGFANGMIVSEWYTKVFQPWLRVHRAKISRPDSPVLLICDGFSGHTNDDLKAMMATDNVRLMFLPPHSSHLTQALDSYIFAVMKRNYNSALPDEGIVDRNGRKISRILKAFYSAATSPMTIRSSWKAVGITGIHDSDGRSLGVEVNGEKVITQHLELSPATGYQRRRHNIQQDYLGNRQALQRVREGRCPHCGEMRARIRPEPLRPGNMPLPFVPNNTPYGPPHSQ